MKNIIKALFTCLVLASETMPVFPQHQNVKISESKDIEEPSIMVNPFNTNEMVAGSNLNYGIYSTDGGQTWHEQTLSSKYGVWGDPCIIIDNSGHYYYFHLSNYDSGVWIDRIVCQKSTDRGKTWSDGTFFGLNGKKRQDKEWATIDRHSGNIYVTWTQFDEYADIFPYKPTDSTNILFTRSEDGGLIWSPPLRLNTVAGDCHDDDNAVEGAVPAVGPNGEVYVCWAGPLGLLFDRSVDSGKTWLANDIFVSDIPGGWNYDIPGIKRCNGLPVIAYDTSVGAYHGNIYINWSDQRNGIFDTDIWFSKSSDGGNNWTPAKRVNNDPAGKQQFFTWMTVDQVTGFIWIVFYDRRNYNDNQTDVYLALSRDGGESFSNFRISQSPFLPVNTIFFGDYTNISAHNNVIRPIWTCLDSTKLSIWTAIVDPLSIGEDNHEVSEVLNSNEAYPNPFTATCWFSFMLRRPSVTELLVLDVFGRTVEVKVKEQKLPEGKYIFTFDPEKIHLPAGIYYFRLSTNDRQIVQKVIYSK